MALRGLRDRDTERRKRKASDPLMRVIVWCGIIGWLTMTTVMVLLSRAKPQSSQYTPNRSMFEQAGISYHLRTGWDQELVGYVFYLLILALILGITGLAFNAQRHRRPDDFYRIHLMLLTLLSAGGILYSIFF